MRTFTFSDAKSHKFWNIELQGKSFTVTYGRQGTAGQTQTKEFANEEKARKEHDKQIQEKLKKGYRETTPSAQPTGGGMREALEAALVANPDDLASHMAYADWLSEQSDPVLRARGEFIQVQLALEDEARPAAERKKLQRQEKKLLDAHARDWLGELAPYLIDQVNDRKDKYGDPVYEYRFARGWLDSVEVLFYSVAFTRTLARAPQVRLLRRLILKEEGYEAPGSYEPGPDIPEEDPYNPAVWPLLRSPYLGNVRVLQLGDPVDDNERYWNCRMSGRPAVGLVKMMPRLEELYLLAQDVDTEQLFGLRTLNSLRILQVYHMDHYPLQKLAKNPSLGNLTQLLCHPHVMREDEPYIRLPGLRAIVRSTTLRSLTHLRLRQTDAGDAGCKEVVDSGILKRLKMLDLRNGCISDQGARMLADCPDLRNLDWLDLTNNCLTQAGVDALKATGVRCTAERQWQPRGDWDADREYLFEGDGE